jgi:ADP-heptose:LPS heptosyltransferase
VTFADLGLDEVVALAARSRLFVGNDAGIAHVAAAVGTPVVVVFGSSNVAHWRPWTAGPAEVVQSAVACAPCPGDPCRGPEQLACIRDVKEPAVLEAVDRVLKRSERHLAGRALDAWRDERTRDSTEAE